MFRSALLATTALILSLPSLAEARSHDNAFESSDSFANSKPVTDGELSHQRGKFIAAGGLTIDFALTSRVLVDGIAQNDISISSDKINQFIPSDLQRIVQIGSGNTNAALNELQKNPNIVTVIQNSQDNRIIQTLNQLDITVNNIESYRRENTLNSIDFLQVYSLK